MRTAAKKLTRFLLAEYGMIVVLFLLCIFFSILTIAEQHPEGAAAARQVAKQIVKNGAKTDSILVIGQNTDFDAAFVDRLVAELESAEFKSIHVIRGEPGDVRGLLVKRNLDRAPLDFIAGSNTSAGWSVLQGLPDRYPALGDPEITGPLPHHWPRFLTRGNLFNVAGQIAAIAIVAIGMTMVILTAGIDLSVGSLMAFSSIVTTWCIREVAAGRETGTGALILCSLAGIAACAAAGAFTGLMITRFEIPPFIATLGMMLMASGLAFVISIESIYEIPEGFTWLSRGVTLGIPNAVILMIVLYLIAQIVMTKTTLGRFIYAVGGNREAAILSGVPVKSVLLTVYTICGALAGLGGVMLVSKLGSGSAKFGVGAELTVIAAVVVGGTSIFGGRGRIFGTLIGAFIIAVIQNGMNLVEIESNQQKVVLGAVILAAVLIDRLREKILLRFDSPGPAAGRNAA